MTDQTIIAELRAKLAQAEAEAEGLRESLAKASSERDEARLAAGAEAQLANEEHARALAAERVCATQKEALERLISTAPAPPWFNTDTTKYVEALDIARAALRVGEPADE